MGWVPCRAAFAAARGRGRDRQMVLAPASPRWRSCVVCPLAILLSRGSISREGCERGAIYKVSSGGIR